MERRRLAVASRPSPWHWSRISAADALGLEHGRFQSPDHHWRLRLAISLSMGYIQPSIVFATRLFRRATSQHPAALRCSSWGLPMVEAALTNPSPCRHLILSASAVLVQNKLHHHRSLSI